MKITREIFDLSEFEAWSEAVSTKEKIVAAGKGQDFIAMIEDLYPEGIDETHLNDLLWFEEEWCFELVGLDADGNEPSDDEDDEDDDEEDEDTEDDEEDEGK